jgi:spore coat protein A
MKLSRRSIIRAATISLASLTGAATASAQQVPLPPNPATWQFQQPLPLLDAAGGTMATADGTGPLTIRMCEFWANVLPPGAVTPGVQTKTRVWGYIQGNECPANGPDDPAVDTYIGPVVLASRGTPTEVTYVNGLGNTTTSQLTFWKNATDQTLHWADPLNNEENGCAEEAMANPGQLPTGNCALNYAGSIPGVAHLHGGEVPPELDGGPDAWFTSDGVHQGHGYYSAGVNGNEAVYTYPNTQESAPIWFHDHVLGATRLNVYAGLAGAYLIKDDDLTLPAGLAPYGLSRDGVFGSDEVTVPVVLQDRQFDTSGQLFFQSDAAGGILWATNPDHPYWNPEFVGDTIVVSGKVWPYLNVEPKRYRFLFINGSNARTYEMFLIDPLKVATPPRLYVIGTDGGYLDAPVLAKKLVMMPGERYSVIVDFAGVPPGTNLVLKNTAKTPFPGGTSPQGATTGQIMQFRVGVCASGNCGAADTSYDPALGTPIRTGGQTLVRLADPATGMLAQGVTAAKTRQLTLNEVIGTPAAGVVDPVLGLPYPGGPLEILVNNTKWSGESPRTYNDFTPIEVNGITTAYSELPQEGETEVWEIVNLTADAHPIHLHLVQFQILSRQSFKTGAYDAVYQAAFPAVAGDLVCTGGVYCPGFGPPLDYNTGNPRALGGNPDIAALGKNGKPLYLTGQPSPPDPNEAGWKDTAVMYPGQVTRIAVRWAPTSLPTTTAAAGLYFPFDPSGESEHGYVWHCHIIDHEDNEMMRPDIVTLNPGAPPPVSRTFVKGIDY